MHELSTAKYKGESSTLTALRQGKTIRYLLGKTGVTGDQYGSKSRDWQTLGERQSRAGELSRLPAVICGLSNQRKS